MPDFTYRAIDANGIRQRGRLRVNHEQEIEHRLEKMGYDLIAYKEIKASGLSLSRKNVSRKDVISFLQHMEQLSRSGVPLLDGLIDLRDTMQPCYFKDLMSSIVDSIEGGSTFSESLAQYPKVFDKVFITLIKVGEQSGKLTEVLHDMAETLKWIDELVAQAKKVMIYPAVVGTVVLGVVTFQMMYLVPQLIPFLQQMGGEIPIQTRALIATSHFFSHYWYLIFSTPVAVVLGIKQLAKVSPKFARSIDATKLKIPIIGPLMLRIKIARFCSYFSLMYSSGITVIEGLRTAKQLVDNLVLEDAVTEAVNAISDGEQISASFANTNLFPPLVIRMLRVGENTGNLDEALDNVSYFYNREVKEAIDKLEPAIQPILTVIMGAMMAWIMIAVLGPVYDSLTHIK
jgi:type IV pilus assembly protein PilC